MSGGFQIGEPDLAAGLDDFARKLDGGVPLWVAGMALPSENDFIGRQLGHMLGREAVKRPAVVAAIHFGDSEADAVTRRPVERLAHGRSVDHSVGIECVSTCMYGLAAVRYIKKKKKK